MKDETFGNRVYIQMYHNNPPTRTISETGSKDIWCRTMWDYNCQQAAEIAAPGDEARVQEAFRQLVLADLPEGFKLPFGDDTGCNVFHLLGSDQEFASLVDTWAKEIQGDVANVGGDDSHYDYFPDYVAGLHQLCQQLGTDEAKIAYNETLDVVQNSEAYRDDPETEDLFDGRL
jgi:hypothetical protein